MYMFISLCSSVKLDKFIVFYMSQLNKRTILQVHFSKKNINLRIIGSEIRGPGTVTVRSCAFLCRQR